MAVGSNAPGHYVHKVITKLVDRLHASKDWLVRTGSAPLLSPMCYYKPFSKHPVTYVHITFASKYKYALLWSSESSHEI